MLEEYVKLPPNLGARTFFDLGLKMNIGETIREILVEAKKENCLIGGLSKASEYLRETDNAENSLFFFIVPTPHGSSLMHMQEVVLQSFCFENDIYIIKLDSAEKLNKILGFEQGFETCALVQRMAPIDRKEKYTDLERILIDHCEYFWNEPIQPTIKLPEVSTMEEP